jgi:hypothetical protein
VRCEVAANEARETLNAQSHRPVPLWVRTPLWLAEKLTFAPYDNEHLEAGDVVRLKNGDVHLIGFANCECGSEGGEPQFDWEDIDEIASAWELLERPGDRMLSPHVLG